MKNEDIKSYVEVHICNHKRDGGEDCTQKGAKDLTDNLKKWAKETQNKEIRVFRSGCLGKCEEGIAIACYPEKKFFLEVKPEDEAEIKSYLEKALKKEKGA